MLINNCSDFMLFFLIILVTHRKNTDSSKDSFNQSIKTIQKYGLKHCHYQFLLELSKIRTQNEKYQHRIVNLRLINPI